MPKITQYKIKPEVFENNDYRIEYRTPSPDSQYFKYKVLDKKKNTKSELRIRVDEECYNIDGKCKLTFVQEDKEPIHLAALRPSTTQRRGDASYVLHPEPQKYKDEPEIGGRRPLHSDGFYHYVKEIDDIMSIHRALKKGDFEINSSSTPSYSKEEAVGSVLNFMDTYIFNTDESKELLAEYMQKYPLPLKDEEAKNEPQIPHKEELKAYPSGSSLVARWANRLKHWQMKLFSRGGKE